MCYSSRHMETTYQVPGKRLGIGSVTDHRRWWRMANIVLICFSLFYRLTWVQRCWPRAIPDFGSASKCDQLVSARRHPKASWYTPFRGSGGVSTQQFVTWFSGAYSRIPLVYRNFFASGGDTPCVACMAERNEEAPSCFGCDDDDGVVGGERLSRIHLYTLIVCMYTWFTVRRAINRSRVWSTSTSKCLVK